MNRLTRIIDLRSITEVRRLGKIAGSKNIPLDRFLELIRDGKINNDNLMVYCQTGARSRRATFIANYHGYKCKDLGGLLSTFVR